MPHPDSKIWYNKDISKTINEKFVWAAPYDARFPQQRRQRKCFAYFVDYYRCKELMGEDYKPCKFFWNVYNDECPKFWLDKWDELREDGRFPAKFDR
uniref:Cytochrome c oxidase subunit n=1 Tax=Acrobeloides nanus TaxID=290746 RepID=A0A914EEP5_9BILA